MHRLQLPRCLLPSSFLVAFQIQKPSTNRSRSSSPPPPPPPAAMERGLLRRPRRLHPGFLLPAPAFCPSAPRDRSEEAPPALFLHSAAPGAQNRQSKDGRRPFLFSRHGIPWIACFSSRVQPVIPLRRCEAPRYHAYRRRSWGRMVSAAQPAWSPHKRSNRLPPSSNVASR